MTYALSPNGELTYRVVGCGWRCTLDGCDVAASKAIRFVSGEWIVLPQLRPGAGRGQPYTAGEAVSLELPEAEGGNVARTYRLEGELPAGLSFDPGTRTISGTPPSLRGIPLTSYTVTYRVADVDGEEPDPLTFSIRVNGIPRFGQ